MRSPELSPESREWAPQSLYKKKEVFLLCPLLCLLMHLGHWHRYSLHHTRACKVGVIFPKSLPVSTSWFFYIGGPEMVSLHPVFSSGQQKTTFSSACLSTWNLLSLVHPHWLYLLFLILTFSLPTLTLCYVCLWNSVKQYRRTTNWLL